MKNPKTVQTERVCVGCGAKDDRGQLQRGDDNHLRCQSCASARRLELCPIKPTDLRAITRRSATCLTVVSIKWDWQTEINWLTFGEAQLRHHERLGTHELMAYLTNGVTDFEHDSAYALSLPLIGLRFTRLDYHSTYFDAWVDPSHDVNRGFRVPRPGYNPMEHPESIMCKDKKNCTDGHIIVPEGHYLPPYDKELFRLVAGKRVEIVITQPRETDE